MGSLHMEYIWIKRYEEENGIQKSKFKNQNQNDSIQFLTFDFLILILIVYL